jgi:hypothetical protein
MFNLVGLNTKKLHIDEWWSTLMHDKLCTQTLDFKTLCMSTQSLVGLMYANFV